MPFLDGTRQSLKLAEIKVLSPDTKLFRFALPSDKHCFGLPLGKHVKIFCPNPTGVVAGKWNGRDDPEDGATEIQRSYTPTSSEADVGVCDLRIKVGDRLALQGPVGMVEYKGRGSWLYGRRPIKAKKVWMMAGGTGITPMFQIVSAALADV